VDSGHGDGYDTRWVERWIDNALFFSRTCQQPLVLVLEMPPAGGRGYAGRNMLGSASVFGSRKLWLHAWRAAPAAVYCAQVSVYPQSWRAPLFGTCVNTRPQEAMHAGRTKHGVAYATVDPDEAAAISIGSWAACAGQVGAVIAGGKR
jgi:hypothetical protein